MRTLERQIGNICHKHAVKIASGLETDFHIQAKDLESYLKKESYQTESPENIRIHGIATGLAVTAF